VVAVRGRAAVVEVDVAKAADAGADQETHMNNLIRLCRVAAALVSIAAAPVLAQQAYATPEAAADDLVDAIARHDTAALKRVVGPDYSRYIPDASVDPEDVTNFLEAWARAHKIVGAGNDRAMLGVGTRGWTLPIPIVKTAAGWRFDTRAAREEMRIRRIGRNELAAIQVALAYTDAQEEYHARDRDGDGVVQYAMRSLSSPGKHDGLYWASSPGEEESPLGPAFADARQGEPYHGYRYKILTAQGAAAPGGARNYIKKGRMTDGYGLIAWPAKYNDTGVMSFLVNQDGIVYQKNLGPGTDAAASAITTYNPDSSWSKAVASK
jgi:Protein of unknown function (DUF2950)